MTLAEILSQFRSLSGRYDLCSADGVDAKAAGTNPGALFFVNAGQRWLESKIDLRQSRRVFTQALTAGTYSYDLSVYVEKIHGIRIADEDGVFSELPLARYDYDTFLFNYPDLATTTDSGIPVAYAEYPVNREGSSYGLTRLYVGPIPDATYTLHIDADVGLGELGTVTSNVWTLLYPDVLILAALFALELFMRNVEGANGYEQSLSCGLPSLHKNF